AVETKAGPRCIEVSVVPKDRGMVEIAVCDSGPGIPPDRLEKIFLPYSAVKGSRGMGIGLFWVKRIVEVMDGTIDVDGSNRHGGATFIVTLPSGR
ncbi:MAG: HAMP domain-containing histidine kinase, partial [Acidobacteria bacterium]|nr:HAMP domain-containing histidine kinase [Acidobacteriota bacterium]